MSCDPPYEFRDKGNRTLTTHFYLKKETGSNTLAEHARAHLNALMLLCHITPYKQYSVCCWKMKHEQANTQSVLAFEYKS